MISPDHKPQTENRLAAGRLLKGIGGIYGIWIGGSLSMHLAGTGLSPDVPFYRWIIVLTFFFHICLAALATAVFLVHGAPVLKDRHRLRFGLIIGCAALSGICFISTRLLTPQLPAVIYIFNTANLIVFANLLGSWMISPIKRPAELVPVCLVMTLADLFSVWSGPSRKVAETIRAYQESTMTGPPPWAEFILIKVAVPGSNRLMSVFGLADWIIIVFFAAAVARFGFNDNLAGRSVADMVGKGRAGFYLPVAALGLFAAVLLAQALGAFLPALPVVVVFFLAFIMSRYPEARRLSRSDWMMTGGAAVVMFAMMTVYRFAA